MADRTAISLGAIIVLVVFSAHSVDAKSLSLKKRAAFYIANGTVCNVDGIIYQNNEKIPTDNPCESCYCRPPGFACVLKDCELKPHCKAVRREGQCCPDYHCDGCEHDGQFYSDGQVIPNTGSPCYTCYCQGASITCSLVSCTFRNDCTARYNPGECCPRYDHCSPKDANTKETLQPATLPTTLFQSRITRFKTFGNLREFPISALGEGEVFPRSDENRFGLSIPPPVRPNFYLTGNAPGAPDRENEISDSQNQREGGTRESSTAPPGTIAPIESSARTGEDRTPVFIGSDSSASRTTKSATAPSTTTERATTVNLETSTLLEVTTQTPSISSTTLASTTPTTIRTTTTTTTTSRATTPIASTTRAAPSTSSEPPATTTSTTTTTTTTPAPPPSTTTDATSIGVASSSPAPTTGALTALPDKEIRHISEDDVTRIDDVTQKLTAVTKSIFRKATSSASTQIADWELEEFRRAVELLETHYKNFYDKAANVTKNSRSHPAPAELRNGSPYITQDMIDALFAGQKIPVVVENDAESPPTTPMPPQKSDEEDIIVPEHRPLLGDGDTGPRVTNITEDEAFRLLREALESDSANRSAVVDQAASTPPPSLVVTPEQSLNSTPASATTISPDTEQSLTELTETTNGGPQESVTPSSRQNDQGDGKLHVKSVIQNLEPQGTTVSASPRKDSADDETRPGDQDDPSSLNDDSQSISATAPSQCNLTRQLTSLLETLSMRSRSHDPILDFLKRAIHSHTVMHPDDVRHFMRKTV